VKFIRFVVEYVANRCSYGLIDFLVKNITFAIEKNICGCLLLKTNHFRGYVTEATVFLFNNKLIEICLSN